MLQLVNLSQVVGPLLSVCCEGVVPDKEDLAQGLTAVVLDLEANRLVERQSCGSGIQLSVVNNFWCSLSSREVLLKKGSSDFEGPIDQRACVYTQSQGGEQKLGDRRHGDD